MQIHDTYFLVAVVDNDFISSDIYSVFDDAIAVIESQSSTDSAADLGLDVN